MEQSCDRVDNVHGLSRRIFDVLSCEVIIKFSSNLLGVFYKLTRKPLLLLLLILFFSFVFLIINYNFRHRHYLNLLFFKGSNNWIESHFVDTLSWRSVTNPVQFTFVLASNRTNFLAVNYFLIELRWISSIFSSANRS